MPTATTRKTPAKTAPSVRKKAEPAAEVKTTRTPRKTATSAKKGGWQSDAPVKTPRKTAASKKAAPAAKPAAKRGATALAKTQKPAPKKAAPAKVVELDETTGFTPGSDSHIIASELLKGGASRVEIIERLRKKLDGETRNGTPKSIANVVASTWAKMRDRGFTVQETYIVLPPTPASKRAAARRRK